MIRALCGAMAVATLTLTCAAASAQETEETSETRTSYRENGKQVYLPAYFQRFSPQTALDMLRNVPGFQIRQGDNRRGLGQGGTNVLINGSRVTGKTNDPLDVLDRTSREAVLRIEIVDGSTLGISGLSGPVADIILEEGKTTGNWEYNPQFREGLAARLTNGSVSMSGMWGDVSYTIGFEADGFRNGAWGPETVTNAAGEVIERRWDEVQPSGEQPEISLALAHEDAKGREANFNGSITLFQYDFSERSKRTPTDPMMPETERLVLVTEDEWNTELSGDYAFDAFGGRLKLIGFQYFEHSPEEVTVTTSGEGGLMGGDRYQTDTDEGESILRAEQSWDRGEKRQIELAAEAAYNFYDGTATLHSIDADGVETPVEIPGANSRIAERRGEVSAAYSFPMGEKLDVQTSLAVEYSELNQTGDVEKKRSFVRSKGFITGAYRATPTFEVRGRLERRVGQLDFGAFISSVNLNAENEDNGNDELVPEQSWFAQLAFEKSFADDSQMTLTFDYEEITDIVQSIPIGDGEGPGNVPEATRSRIEFIGTQMLEKFGIPGGQFEWDITLRNSDITDPFSGESRRLNGETKIYYRGEFRHDIPNTDYAYGFSVEDFEDALQYRGSEISLYDQSKPTYEIYFEHKDFFGANATIYVYNLANYTEDFSRDVYDGFRPDAPLKYREARQQAFNPIVGINLSGTF